MITVILSAPAFIVVALLAGYRHGRAARPYMIQLLAISALFLILRIARAAISGAASECVIGGTGIAERSVARLNP